MISLLRALVLCSIAVKAAESARSLRKGRDARSLHQSEGYRSLQDELLCNIKVIDGQLEDGTDKEFFQCSLDRDDDGFYEYAYIIDLPEDFVNANRDCIRRGECFLNITGGEAIDDNNVPHPIINVPVAASISAEDNQIQTMKGNVGNLRSRVIILHLLFGSHQQMVHLVDQPVALHDLSLVSVPLLLKTTWRSSIGTVHESNCRFVHLMLDTTLLMVL